MDELEPITPDNDSAFHRLVDEGTPVASADALRAIVARRDRWRVRSLAITLAVAVVGLPIAGYAVGQARSSGTVIRAAKSPTNPAPAASSTDSGGAVAQTAIGFGGTGPTPKQLFVRDTNDGVRIRGYAMSFPTVTAPKCETAIAPVTAQPPPAAPPPSPGAGQSGANQSGAGQPNISPPVSAQPVPCPQPPSPACIPSGLLDAQVSDDQVAGQTSMPVFASADQPLDVVGAQVTGTGEPTPIGTVLLRTGAGVANVELTFQNGSTDRMSPVDGYAILGGQVHDLPIVSIPIPFPPVPQGASKLAPVPPVKAVGLGFPKATVRAFDGSGKQVASVDLPSLTSANGPDACGAGGFAFGTAAGSATASAGTATAGTATAGAGTATESGTATASTNRG